jgi:hypothetical protein
MATYRLPLRVTTAGLHGQATTGELIPPIFESSRGSSHHRRRRFFSRFRPENCGVARCSPPAVSEAGDMPDEDLVRAEGVPVGVAGWVVG